MKEIEALENRYGTVLFRMALTHLVDVGVRNLTGENVEESFRQIMADEESNKANGVISVMTPEFQCEIVRSIGDNLYLAEYNGVRCTAIFNPFVGRYFVDDMFGILKENNYA